MARHRSSEQVFFFRFARGFSQVRRTQAGPRLVQSVQVFGRRRHGLRSTSHPPSELGANSISLSPTRHSLLFSGRSRVGFFTASADRRRETTAAAYAGETRGRSSPVRRGHRAPLRDETDDRVMNAPGRDPSPSPSSLLGGLRRRRDWKSDPVRIRPRFTPHGSASAVKRRPPASIEAGGGRRGSDERWRPSGGFSQRGASILFDEARPVLAIPAGLPEEKSGVDQDDDEPDGVGDEDGNHGNSGTAWNPAGSIAAGLGLYSSKCRSSRP